MAHSTKQDNFAKNESDPTDLATTQLIDKMRKDLSFANDQIALTLSEFDTEQTGTSHDNAATGNLLTFVIPAKDEQDTVAELNQRIIAAVPAEYDLEIIWIDDGSSDATWQQIEQLVEEQQQDERSTVRGIRFRHNAGKAAALTAGFRAAQGALVFTMDADLQDDPQEIPRFLEAINNGFDVVSGWKKKRHDPWHKVLPSRVFNYLLSRLTGVHLHDHNCGFKCYRGKVARSIVPHGELHRMMPCLASMHGFRTTEIEVQHHARAHGLSKYGIERFARGFSDMLTMSFLKHFGERPSHFINCVAAANILFAMFLSITALTIGITSAQGCVIGMTALVFGGLATTLFVGGLLAEIAIRDGRMTNRQLPIAEMLDPCAKETRNSDVETHRLASKRPQKTTSNSPKPQCANSL